MDKLAEQVIQGVQTIQSNLDIDEATSRQAFDFIRENIIECEYEKTPRKNRSIQKSVTLDAKTLQARSRKLRNIVIDQGKLLIALASGTAGILGGITAPGILIPAVLHLITMLSFILQLKESYTIKLSEKEALALWSLYLAGLKQTHGCSVEEVLTEYQLLSVQLGHPNILAGELTNILHVLADIHAVKSNNFVWQIVERIEIVL